MTRLASKGVAAHHVAHVGLSGKTDPEVWNWAFTHDQIVATINAEDFLRLAAGVPLHLGLIVLRSRGLSREGQWQWLEPAIDFVLSQREFVNKVMEVTAVGILTTRQLPGS